MSQYEVATNNFEVKKKDAV